MEYETEVVSTVNDINTYRQEPKALHNSKAYTFESYQDKIISNLISLGASRWDLLRSAVQHLPRIISPTETLTGMTFGRSIGKSYLMVATDTRVIFLDKKLLFINTDEFNYASISGVSHTRGIIWSRVVIHTRVGDFAVSTINHRAARIMKEAVERKSAATRQYIVRN